MPDGTVRRKFVYGKTEAEATRRMVDAQQRSERGLPVQASTKLADYLRLWLQDVAAVQLRLGRSRCTGGASSGTSR